MMKKKAGTGSLQTTKKKKRKKREGKKKEKKDKRAPQNEMVIGLTKTLPA